MTGAIDKSDIPPQRWHVTLMEMIAAVSSAFASNGRPQPVAEIDAQIAVEAIYKTFRGNMVYIPFSAETKRAFLHARIFAEFDGHNQRDLSRRHELSVQAIYRIIKKQRELKSNPTGDKND